MSNQEERHVMMVGRMVIHENVVHRVIELHHQHQHVPVFLQAQHSEILLSQRLSLVMVRISLLVLHMRLIVEMEQML